MCIRMPATGASTAAPASEESGTSSREDGGRESCAMDEDCDSEATCDDEAGCQGTREKRTCVKGACKTSTYLDDDSACGVETVASECGLFKPVSCDGEPDQLEPECPTACIDDSDCDPSANCRDGSCVALGSRADGETCDTNSECRTKHCANGFCCAAGDCCAKPSQCPAEFESAATCDESVSARAVARKPPVSDTCVARRRSRTIAHATRPSWRGRVRAHRMCCAQAARFSKSRQPVPTRPRPCLRPSRPRRRQARRPHPHPRRCHLPSRRRHHPNHRLPPSRSVSARARKEGKMSAGHSIMAGAIPRAASALRAAQVVSAIALNSPAKPVISCAHTSMRRTAGALTTASESSVSAIRIKYVRFNDDGGLQQTCSRACNTLGGATCALGRWPHCSDNRAASS
jgi:hypothetical protein